MDARDILNLNTPTHSPLTELAGAVRVGDSRVTLDTVINAYRQGFSAEDIVGRFPDLGLEEVYGVLLLYLRHRETIDAYVDERNATAEKYRIQWETKPDQRQLRDRLLESLKRAS